jgi:hypothetical protein
VRWRCLALESALAARAGDAGRAERLAAGVRELTAGLAAALPDARLRRGLTRLGDRIAGDPIGALR